MLCEMSHRLVPGLAGKLLSFWALHVDLGEASQGWAIMRLNPVQWHIC